MSRAEIAKQYFYQGYACSQCIVMAFSDLINIDIETLKKASLPFGAGIGRLRLTCGAFTGMAMVVGLLLSNNPDIEENKKETYERVQELAKRFEQSNETINCEQLLKAVNLEVEKGGAPEFRNDEYYKKRPCGKIVYSAAIILEEYLNEKEII